MGTCLFCGEILRRGGGIHRRGQAAGGGVCALARSWPEQHRLLPQGGPSKTTFETVFTILTFWRGF